MIEDFARHWLAAMLGVSIQFTVLAAMAAAALFVSRPLAPRVRHAVWLLVLLRLTIPVGLTSPFGVVPASLVGPPSRGAPPVATVPGNGLVETSTAVANPASASGTGSGSGSGSGESGASTTRSAPAAPAVVLLLAWAGGVLVLASTQLVRAARRRMRTRGSTSLPPRIEVRIDELRRELGLRGTVDARMVPDDAVAGPVVQGFVSPRVLLPARLVRSWRHEELDAVLLHELVHLRRRDPAVRALANLLQIVYFFHPLVWWVGRRLAAERERACDDAVVRRLRGGKRAYIDSLLRLVEERSPAYDTPGLGMAPGRRPLAMRLKRMLRRRYEPEPATRVVTLAALALGVGLGLALSTGARPLQPGQSDEPPRISARTSWSAALLADSFEEIDGADRVTIGGDFTIGRPTTSLTPDAAALAARDPALFDRLDALGRLTATLVVDRAGVVRRVRFEDHVDEDLREPFLELLDAARFDPATHFERGPVIVEVQVDYFINPVLPRQSLYDPGEVFAGPEVADVLPSQAGSPRFTAILEKGEPPPLEVGDEELILSFWLSVDGGGNVESVALFRDSRTLPPAQSNYTTEESEALAPYLETFRFEPIPGDGGPVGATLMLDLRVSAQGVEVATRGVDEEELERRLAEVYRLPEGRNLDLLPPPHPPERVVLYRTGHPAQARAIPNGPDQMTIVWSGDRPTLGGACFGCEDLLDMLGRLGLGIGHDVRLEGGAENVRIRTDVVRREGASREALLNELSRVLEERFDLGLDFRVVGEPSRALVLRGSIGELAPDDHLDGSRALHVFTEGRNEPGVGGGAIFANLDLLADLMSGHLGIPVVNETSGTVAQPFQVILHDSAHTTQRLDLLIRNLESQTDLDIVVEEDRPREILVVSRRPS